MESNVEIVAGNTGVRPAQVKLRTACNQCCTAKVKCSGQREGCDRCRSTGARCIYSESRVGKVAGIRAKKTQTVVVSTESQKRQRRISSPAITQCASSPASSTAPTERDQDADSEATIWWSPGWNSSSSHNNIAVAANSKETPGLAQFSMSATNPSSFGPLAAFAASNDFCLTEHFGDIMGPPSPLPAADGQQADMAGNMHQQLPLLRGIRERTETDSHCCQDCCHLITEIENFINLELKDAKIIIGILKQVIEKVTHLISLQQGSANLRCLMLFLTLLYQMIELMDGGFAAMAAEETRQRTRSITGGSINLGFGGFSLGVDNHCASMKQEFLKEIRQAETINVALRAMVEPVPGGSATTGLHSPQSKALSNCFLDIQSQLNELAQRIS
ncbi:hypothetical protein EV127DRAFT_475884 [Xylaria flabelliformis]|nr:hypothetical protein EV127DRAFT_475884 [Xylaria flabelliformis]